MKEENPSYQLSTSVNDGIVEIVFTGELTNTDLDQVRAEAIAILRENKARAVLCDVRALKGPQDIITAYYRVRSIPRDVTVLPCAIVEPTRNVDFQSFYETTAANIGQSMRYFADVEAARAWLKSRLETMGRTV